MLLGPDEITAYSTAGGLLVTAATTAYVRASRRARRTLRAQRRLVQAYRDALETTVEVAATNRRIAIDEGVETKKLRRIPRKVLDLTAADGVGEDDKEDSDGA